LRPHGALDPYRPLRGLDNSSLRYSIPRLTLLSSSEGGSALPQQLMRAAYFFDLLERRMSLDSYHRERRGGVERLNRTTLRAANERAGWRMQFVRRAERRLRLQAGPQWSKRIVIAVVALAAASLAVQALSPWPLLVTVRHVLAGYNCDTARMVGLAPARRGMPGYWLSRDADGDGISCEPWPPSRAHRAGISATGQPKPKYLPTSAYDPIADICLTKIEWISGAGAHVILHS
jgi:hypothetical protein